MCLFLCFGHLSAHSVKRNQFPSTNKETPFLQWLQFLSLDHYHGNSDRGVWDNMWSLSCPNFTDSLDTLKPIQQVPCLLTTTLDIKRQPLNRPSLKTGLQSDYLIVIMWILVQFPSLSVTWSFRPRWPLRWPRDKPKRVKSRVVTPTCYTEACQIMLYSTATAFLSPPSWSLRSDGRSAICHQRML